MQRSAASFLAGVIVTFSLALSPGWATAEDPGEGNSDPNPGGKTVEVYDVADLVVAGDSDPLLGLLMNCIYPESWDESGGDASAAVLRDKLTVRQSRQGHELIGALLAGIRKYPKINRQRAAAFPQTPATKVAQWTTDDKLDLQLVIYPVTDLTENADLEPLVDLIGRTVEPNQWDFAGGPGALQPVADRDLLVVVNGPVIHNQIAKVLANLRSKGGKKSKVGEGKQAEQESITRKSAAQ